MRIFNFWVFSLFFLCSYFSVFAQNELRKIESDILNRDKKAAIKELQKIPKDNYFYILQKVIYKKASYDDYFDFVSRLELSGKSQHERLYEFINQIPRPKSTSVIDLDYIKLKWVQINDLRNDVSLERATKENEKLLA
jgi:hypothetical protein